MKTRSQGVHFFNRYYHVVTVSYSRDLPHPAGYQVHLPQRISETTRLWVDRLYHAIRGLCNQYRERARWFTAVDDINGLSNDANWYHVNLARQWLEDRGWIVPSGDQFYALK